MTERIRKILRGKNITPKTADEAAVKAALPLYVPFTVTVDETTGDISATTTAEFDTVRDAVLARKTVIAEVALDDNITVYAPLSSKNPAAAPTVLTFSLAVDIGDETAAPQLMQIGFAVNEVKATVVDLAIVT